MNLIVIEKSRKMPKPGDIFTFTFDNKVFRFGQVIITNSKIGPMENCFLIYIFSVTSEKIDLIPSLNTSLLLVPPIMTNKKGWSDGVFKTIGNKKLEQTNVLPKHFFYSKNRDKYYNEFSEEVEYDNTTQFGVWGLHSYLTISDEVKKKIQ